MFADDEAAVARLEAILGGRVVTFEPAPWGTASRTWLVTLDDGRRLAVQRLTDLVAARYRARVSATLGDRLRAAGVPVPWLVVATPAADVLAWERIDGEPGSSLLGDPTDAIALGTEMGRLVGRLASVEVRDVRLPATWGSPARLAAVGARWLARARPLLAPDVAAEAERLVGRVVPAFAGRPVVLAHGDWAPVNVLVHGRAVVGVVDWEHARLADPLFDPAWWAWIVWHHHPERYAAAAPALFETAGVALDAETVERCRILVTLRLLEAIAARRAATPPGVAARWADRLSGLLRTDG